MEVNAQVAQNNVIPDNIVPIDRRIGGSKGAANRENSLNLLSDFKGSVKIATTGNVSLSGLSTIDGIALTAGDRVLVKNQTDASENGIYIASSGNWNRANDCNSNSKVNPGLFVIVEKGTTNSDTGWVLTSDGPIDLGVTSLSFTKFGTTLSGDVKTELLSTSPINLSYDSQADTLTVSIDSAPTFTGLDVDSNIIRIRNSKTPASSTDTGTAGQICWDSSFLYICIATNTWRRIVHSTW
jgi:hypothetical protein